MSKTIVFGVRVEPAEKIKFFAFCKKKGLVPNDLIKQFMRTYRLSEGKMKLFLDAPAASTVTVTNTAAAKKSAAANSPRLKKKPIKKKPK